MALDGYRAYRDTYVDNGITPPVEILGEKFSPDFYNRDSCQVWDVSNYEEVSVGLWKGNTLNQNSLHVVTIVNNSNHDTEVNFSKNYLLVDEEIAEAADLNRIVIPPTKTAYFYCTGILYKGVMVFKMRTGSQDSRKN